MAGKTARSHNRARDTTSQPQPLKGWQQISEFLGQPVSVVQRWAGEGMPVRKEGRYVTASPEELSGWLGKESGANDSVHIATDNADLTADLKRGLADLKHHTRQTAVIADRLHAIRLQVLNQLGA